MLLWCSYCDRYNADELKTPDMNLSSKCDCEVLFKHLLMDRSYSATDAEMASVLFKSGRGSFAISNCADVVVELSRDPLGIRPLFYAQTSTTIVVSSESKPILVFGEKLIIWRCQVLDIGLVLWRGQVKICYTGQIVSLYRHSKWFLKESFQVAPRFQLFLNRHSFGPLTRPGTA